MPKPGHRHSQRLKTTRIDGDYTMDPLDDIPSPPRPIVSREIRTTLRFSACLTRAGLIVQRHETGKGVRMADDHPQYGAWVQCLDMALDDVEFDLLCGHLA